MGKAPHKKIKGKIARSLVNHRKVENLILMNFDYILDDYLQNT